MNVLAVLPGFIPSTIIGVLRPLAELERRKEIKLRLRLNNVPIPISHDIDWCDVAVFCRNCEVEDLYVLYELKRKDKKVVYEIDDNFEEIPLTTEIGEYHRSFFRLHVLKRFFALSDVTRVYSDRLLQCVVAHGARPQAIRSYFDKSIIHGLSRRPSDGVIKIAYPTGRIDDRELEDQIFSAVRMILKKYSGKVEFHIWRKSLPRQLSGVKGVVLNKGVRGYDKFIQSFFEAGFDIGLGPGLDTSFFHSKTNNKYREFGGCGIAGVYSDFPPYSNSVIHEQSGLLAGNSTAEWAADIERLVLDDKLRARIVKNAAVDVFSNYTFENAVESWRECLALLGSLISVTPEWLPSPKQFPIFSFINMGLKEDKLDRRFEYVLLACKVIPNSLLEQFAAAEDYLKSGWFRRIASASIFLVNDEVGLKTLSQLITLSPSAIVDLTTYEGDIDGAVRNLLGFTSIVPISFLVTLEQTKAFPPIQTSIDYVLTIKGQPSLIDQEFSLEGYPAAYLDLLERHIRHAPVKKTSSFLMRPLVKIHVFYDRYAIWKGRLETLSMFIKWRLGLRIF